MIITDMKIELFVGIDVGVDGAICSYHAPTKRLEIVDLPQTVEEVSEYFEGLLAVSKKVLVCIEQVTFWRSDASNGKMFRTDVLIRRYNELTTILRLMHLPHVRVTPKEWQSYMNLVTQEKEKYYDRKKRLSQSAQLLFPNIKMKTTQADAALILHFLMKKYSFDIEWIEKKIPNSVMRMMQ